MVVKTALITPQRLPHPWRSNIRAELKDVLDDHPPRTGSRCAGCRGRIDDEFSVRVSAFARIGEREGRAYGSPILIAQHHHARIRNGEWVATPLGRTGRRTTANRAFGIYQLPYRTRRSSRRL